MADFPLICASRRYCADCRSRPAWRQAFGAPEICPFGVETGQVPADSSKKTPISGQIDARRAICAACEHFQRPACCNCPTARQDPARELNSCRFGKWDLAPETAGATLRETTGHSHALGNRQLENPG